MAGEELRFKMKLKSLLVWNMIMARPMKFTCPKNIVTSNADSTGDDF